MEDSKITKLEAARRILEAAIRATKEEADPLFICCGAYGAFTNLREYSRASGAGVWAGVLKGVGEEKRWHALLNRIPNFLKHAKHDHELTLDEFRPEFNDLLIFLACKIYQALGQVVSPEMTKFMVFFAVGHGEILFSVEESRQLYGALKRLAGAVELGDRKKQLELWRSGKFEISLSGDAALTVIKLFAEIGVRLFSSSKPDSN